ncbi:MAG: hydrogen gas-evolving membrane-bound hydrogenase subunit E [Bacillota bacterium]
MTINWQEVLYVGLIVLLVVVIAMVLFMAVMEMPLYGELGNPTNNYVMRRYVDVGVTESGGYNYVTNILLDYRGYDTLLETTVIFTSVMCIMVLWGVKSNK